MNRNFRNEDSMKYTFDNLTNRFNTNSVKWNVKDHELPMWVADMDFETVPAIKEAILEKANAEIFGYTAIPDEWYETI